MNSRLISFIASGMTLLTLFLGGCKVTTEGPAQSSGSSTEDEADKRRPRPTVTPSPTPTATATPTPTSTATPTPTATPTVLPATALFSDNFDSREDWSPRQQARTTVTCVQGQTCATAVPSGYYDYRVAGTESCSNLDGEHETININGLHPRGGTGKSFLMWNEPCYSSGGSWGSDGLLGVSFPEQKEIYVRYWIKFQPDWVWPTGVSPSPMQKFLHISHLNKDISNLWDFFGGIQNKPRFTPQMAKFGGGTYRIQFGLPHSPLTPARDSSLSFNSNAYLGPSPLDWTTPGPGELPPPGDGNWHSFEFHVKMNDKGLANGLERAWYDGALVNTTTGIAWVPAADDPALWLWNHAWLGGNNSVLYTPQQEQWYAVDDFVVSTHYSGPPPRPVNLAAQSIAPKTVKLTWAAGDNGTTYLLSGYRISYGTSPTALDQTVLSQATSYQIEGLEAGKTYYFAVSAVKRASYDSNDNESPRSVRVSVAVN